MNAIKKITVEKISENHSPKLIPEIMKLAKKINSDSALVYEVENKPFFIETERLIIRRFTLEDSEAVLELSLNRKNSSMKNFDHQWPDDLEGCKEATEFFAEKDIYFAVCLKKTNKLIGFISYNGIDENGIVDIGHVWNTLYQDNSYDTEALSIMAQYAFENLGANGISATNPLYCAEQIAPLKSMGMSVVSTNEGFFVNDENGKPITFIACLMQITKDEWEKYFSPKTRPEIINLADKVDNTDYVSLPPSANVPFSGAIDTSGPNLVPHTRAFASAMTSLSVFMGKPHDTHIIHAHNTTFLADHDYFMHLMVSGEGFLFWQDIWNYFAGEAPQNYDSTNWESYGKVPKSAEPILDCFEICGISAEIYSNYSFEGLSGGWESDKELKEKVMKNIASGFPVMLFSSEPGDKIILAIGYEKSGDKLLTWKFSAGDDKNNKTFSPDKCKKLTNWTKNIYSIVLIKSLPETPDDIKPMLLKALKRGVKFLRENDILQAYRDSFINDSEPRIYPPIWDLAERRAFLASELEIVAEKFETDKLAKAIEANNKIHENMWKIDAVFNENGKQFDSETRRKISEILDECHKLDLQTADEIESFVSFIDSSRENFYPKNKPEVLNIMEKIKTNEIFVEKISDLCSIVDKPEQRLIGISVPITFESQGYPSEDMNFSNGTMNDYFIAKKYITDGTIAFLAETVGVDIKATEIISARFDVHGDGNYKVIIGFQIDNNIDLPKFLPEHTETLTIPESRYAKIEINEEQLKERKGYPERMHADEYFIGEFREHSGYIFDTTGFPMNSWNEKGHVVLKYEPVKKPINDNERFGTFEFTPVKLPQWKIACCVREHDDNEGNCISDFFNISVEIYKTKQGRLYQNGEFYGFPVDYNDTYKPCFGMRVSSFEDLPDEVEKITLPGGDYVHITQKEFNGDNPSMTYDIAFNHMSELFFANNQDLEFDHSRKVIARFRQANCASVFVPVTVKN